jgi:hypothetical protein
MRSEPQVNIRLPATLKIAIEDQARKNGRSITSEIVTRLQTSIEGETHHDEFVVHRVEVIEDSLKRLEATVQVLCKAFLDKEEDK